MSGGSKEETQSSGTKDENYTRSGTTSAANLGGSYTAPVAPDGWEAFWSALQPGSGGLSADQTAALAALRGNVGGTAALTNGPGAYFARAATADPTGGVSVDPALGYFNAAAAGNPGYGDTFTLAQLQRLFPSMYGPIANVSAQQVGATSVTPQTGASFMGAYANPFESQVVGSALGDIDRKYALLKTAKQNALSAAGAFGGSASAAGNALLDDDYLREIGSTAANLRSAGFNAAAGYGQTDAARFLQGAGLNQDAGLRASLANQSAGLAADTTNQANQTGRQEFDVNAAYQGQAGRNTAAQNLATTLLQKMGVNLQATAANTSAAQSWASTIANALGIDNQTALALMGAGGVGQSQNLNWLTAGLPLFGQEGGQFNLGQGTTDESGQSHSDFTGTQTTSKSPGFLDVLGSLGGLATGLGNLGWKPFCWVAREVYGAENPRWLDFRAWMLRCAPRWLLMLYIRHGERVAEWLRDKPRMKAVLRWTMDLCIAGGV